MGKTLILKSLLRSLNSISFMLIIFTFKLIQTIRILWFCHRSPLFTQHQQRPSAPSAEHNWRHYGNLKLYRMPPFLDLPLGLLSHQPTPTTPHQIFSDRPLTPPRLVQLHHQRFPVQWAPAPSVRLSQAPSLLRGCPQRRKHPHDVDPPNLSLMYQAPISMATLQMKLKRNILLRTGPAHRPHGIAHIWSNLSLWQTQLSTPQQVPTCSIPIWDRAAANEFGRLAQGVGERIEGSNMIYFIPR
jgi:hypothetical protein